MNYITTAQSLIIIGDPVGGRSGSSAKAPIDLPQQYETEKQMSEQVYINTLQYREMCMNEILRSQSAFL